MVAMGTHRAAGLARVLCELGNKSVAATDMGAYAQETQHEKSYVAWL